MRWILIAFSPIALVQVETGVRTTLLSPSESCPYEELVVDAVITPDSSIIITTKQVISFEEYFELLEIDRGASVALFDAVEDGERVLLETSFVVNDAADLFGHSLSGISGLSLIYSTCSLVEDSVNYYDITHNPNISDRHKEQYSEIYFAKTIINLTSIISTPMPIVSPLFSILSFPLSLALNNMEKDLNAEIEASEQYTKINGSQCTNRGSIGARFYVPNYGGGQKPTMHTSGRMYGGGYVNQKDTNYDISLNGKPVGETHNSGLTDLHMEEILTDDLLPGQENSLEFDYDTSPGSHSVSTETEIILLYPHDTEIAYIDQPDDLRDVRTKPDFCVYGENIYTDDSAIVGEPTKVHFNVYNRGSRGGWFTMTCTDDSGNIVHQKVNYYLAAFSGETFSVNWTPTKTSTTFTVTLVNTSVNLEERSCDNNTASHVLTARNRPIPTLTSSHAGTIYENEPFSVVINVEQGQDIVGESFSVFGTGIPSFRNLQYESSSSGASRRYRVYSDSGLAAGDYSVNVLLSYLKSASTRGTKLESIDFTVEQRAWVIPSISAPSSATLRYGDQFTFSVHDIDNLLRTEIAVDAGTPVIVTPTDSQSSYSRYYSAALSNYNEGEHSISIRPLMAESFRKMAKSLYLVSFL